MVYLDELETGPPTRTEHYLAQIALEVQRTINPKSGKKLKLKQFLFNFVYPNRDASAPIAETDEQRKNRISSIGKLAWMAVVGPPKNRKP